MMGYHIPGGVRMKKILAVVLVLVFGLALVGCGGKEQYLTGEWTKYDELLEMQVVYIII